MNYRYKVFFTIFFHYKVGHKKTVSKSFKSDYDLTPLVSGDNLTDSNVLKKWTEYALSADLNDLNPPNNLEEKKASKKKLITHRIVNLISLTEVF